MTLLSGIMGRPFLQVDATDPNWMVSSTEPSPGDYDYSTVLDSVSLVTDNPTFPTTADEVTFEVAAAAMQFSSNLIYIGLDEYEERLPYFTMTGSAHPNYGMLEAAANIGRISKLTFDFDETAYGSQTFEQALGGKLGLQLREGQNPEYLSAEDDDSGPTYANATTWVIEWDLTIRERTHPFFLDESRLDDISNFRFFALGDLHFESITITGTHFLEVSNGTPYYMATNVGSAFSFDGFIINYDNRIDYESPEDGFTYSGFSSAVEAGYASPELFTITTIDTYDGTNTMSAVDVPHIIVGATDPLLEVIATYPDDIRIPITISGWISMNDIEYGTDVSVEYGGQTIDSSYFDAKDAVSINGLGNQTATILFLNADCMFDAIVTFETVTIADPVENVDTSPIVGSILGMICDVSDVDYEDIFEDGGYANFTFNTIGGYISLAENYRSTGAVDYIDVILEPSEFTATTGGSASNLFEVALIDENGNKIPKTVKTVELEYSYYNTVISYEHVSGYRGVGFILTCLGINDYIITMSVSVDGREFVDEYYSYDMQAIDYTNYFLGNTMGLRGVAEDSVCVFGDSSTWDELGYEYDYMIENSQTRLHDNRFYMADDDIDLLLERYQYIVNNSDDAYEDFMGIIPVIGAARPQSFSLEIAGIMFFAMAFIGSSIGYFMIKKQKNDI